MNLDWIAGFVDGEGCLTVRIDVYANRYHIDKSKWYNVIPTIGITQCNRKILQGIRVFLGFGSIHSKGARIEKGVHFRAVHEYYVGGWRNCKRFLDLVGPHIIMKKRQVQLMYRIIEERGEVGRGHRITPQKLLTLIDLAKKLRLLNYRDPEAALQRLDSARALVLERLTNYEEKRMLNGWWGKAAWLAKPSVNKRLRSHKETKEIWLRMQLHLPMRVRRYGFSRHDAQLFNKPYVKPH